jgi:hypothetical protein
MPIALGAITWIVVTGMAIACFARALPPYGPLLLQRELLGFTSAFAVAGAISGSISTAIYGRRRGACGLWVTLMAVLAIAVAATRWGIARLTGPSGPWFDSEWAYAWVSIGFGMALGGFAGVIASGIVAAFATLTRRRTTWTIGLAVATLLAAMGFWVLPHVIPQMFDRMVESAHWHYGSACDEAIRGACVGAGLGGLIGSVVLIVVVRVSERRQRDRARPDRVESRSGPATGHCSR